MYKDYQEMQPIKKIKVQMMKKCKMSDIKMKLLNLILHFTFHQKKIENQLK